MNKLYKETIKTMYLRGFNASEIAIKINSHNTSKKLKKESIQKFIQRNFKELKTKHEIAVIARRETLKAVNYESKKQMTDKAFILKNRSIYKTNGTGDIVINREVAPVITWDTPVRLTNENKVAPI